MLASFFFTYQFSLRGRIGGRGVGLRVGVEYLFGYLLVLILGSGVGWLDRVRHMPSGTRSLWAVHTELLERKILFFKKKPMGDGKRKFQRIFRIEKFRFQHSMSASCPNLAPKTPPSYIPSLVTKVRSFQNKTPALRLSLQPLLQPVQILRTVDLNDPAYFGRIPHQLLRARIQHSHLAITGHG